MWKLYIIHLRKDRRRSMINQDNRQAWIGLEPSYESARKKAVEMYPDFEPVWFSEMNIFELIYLLPFFSAKQTRKIE